MLPNTYRWKTDTLHTQENFIQQILNKRGISDLEQVDKFLYPSMDDLHSPYLLNDMEKAVERISECKSTQKHIVIYGDYDVDGITSTSILYMFLKKAEYNISYYIPNRQTEGYGLNKEALAKIATYADLVITVDTGIAAVEEVDFANDLGLDMIITDHHECQEQLPKAYCIINPKRKDSTYPFDALAGVGVTFKLIHAIAIDQQIEESIWEYMDLVALGTIADVVPLTNENRVMSYLGFQRMQNTGHIGLKELINVICEGSIKDKISSNIIAYQIGPRINAAGRLSDAKKGVELLTTQDIVTARALAQDLNNENKKRQDMEAHILEQAENYIQQHIDIEKEKVLIVVGKQWHHGVIGIVASKLMSKYYRPTIVLTEEEGILSGSARSIEGFNIFEAIYQTKDYLLRFGGHEMAAGLSLDKLYFNTFKTCINRYADVFIDEQMLIPCLDIDLELNINEIDLLLCETLEKLEPFGACNPVPIFSLRANIHYLQTIGQNDQHLKLTLEQDKQTIEALGFYKGYLAEYLSEGEEIILACEVVKNIWNNKVSVQLRIKDIQSLEEEVLRSKYYMSLYEYLKTPQLSDNTALYLSKEQQALTDAKVIYVYTETALKKLLKQLNSDFRICYNKACSNNDKTLIIVNPIDHVENSVHYEWDYRTMGAFSSYQTSLIAHKEQLEKMIPSHKDCIEVYKLLKNNRLPHIPLHKIMIQLSSYHMTEYKLLNILEVFKELILLTYTLDKDLLIYQIQDSQKTSLLNSGKYRDLQLFMQTCYHLME